MAEEQREEETVVSRQPGLKHLVSHLEDGLLSLISNRTQNHQQRGNTNRNWLG